MISEPIKYIERFAKAGADIITFHLESESSTEKTIETIKKCGIRAGLSIKPNTEFEKVIPFISNIDLLLIMTVEPGFGGQAYIDKMTDKIKKAYRYIKANNLDVKIQVDGGINQNTAKAASEAGADILVAGNYLFRSENMKKRLNLYDNLYGRYFFNGVLTFCANIIFLHGRICEIVAFLSRSKALYRI